jgi:hypothetical protein
LALSEDTESGWHATSSQGRVLSPQFVVVRADRSYVCTTTAVFVNELETSAFADSIARAVALEGPRRALTWCPR